MTIPEAIHVPGFPNTAAARARLATTLDRTYGHGVEPGLFDPETETIRVIFERPDARRFDLSADFKASQIDTLNQKVRGQGYDLVEVDLHSRTAVACHLTPAQRSIRSRLAQKLKCELHQIEVLVEHEGERIDMVEIIRHPEIAGDEERRRAFWRDVVTVIPGAHVDWVLDEDPVSGRVLMLRRDRLVLPDMVNLLDILPTTVDASNWATPAFGVDAFGNHSSINLRRAPHLLVVGATGAGKTVCINAQIASRLLAGHDLVVIETEKKFADFRSLIPFLRADTRWTPGEQDVVRYRKAVSIFEHLRIEADRRASLFVEHDVQAMWELPADVRERENVRPVTIVLDEADGAFEPVAVPNLTDKQDPRLVEAAEINEQKALLNYHLAYFAKTFRSVGFSLIVGLQRADVAALGGSDSKLGGRLRNNLPGGVFLAVPGEEPDAEGLRMLFKTAAVDAAETRRRFDTGRQGLALTSVDEVPGLSAVRVGYAPVRDIVTALRERGVPEVEQWDIDVSKPHSEIEFPDAFDAFGSFEPEAAAAPEPVVGTEFEFNLDDDLPERRGAKRHDPEDDDPFAGFPA